MDNNFISKLKSLSIKATEAETQKSPSSSEDETDQTRKKAARRPRRRGRSKALGSLTKTLRLEQLGGILATIPQRMVYRGKPVYRYKRFWLLVAAFSTGSGLAIAYWQLEQSLPDTSDIPKFVRSGTLTIKAADGTVLQQLGPATREKLPLQKIPPRLAEAFIASEDRRFYQHDGIDYQSIVRATASNLVARDVVEGGSTITQQLARIVYLNQERSLWRKLQEAGLAHKIEREHSKEQILERYLNLVYLGSGAYGVADAAWIYFSKSVNQLTLAEIATIAGLPPAPSVYSPLVNLQAAQERRNVVLQRMQDAGYITAAEAAEAKAQALKLKPSVPRNLYSDTPYFTSYVQQQLPKYVSKEQLEEGGLTVETTLNPKWQKAAQEAVQEAVSNIGAYEGFQQAALVAIDPRTGEIRAMVGGTDFTESQFNRVTQAQRQPGSSFKTLVYTAAIATGLSPHDGYLDAPYMVDGYKPENYSRKFSGWLSMRDALKQSINVIAVKVLVDTGFDPVVKMARSMGIKSKLMPTYSLALGASEVNLMELTNAYGTLANKGKYIEAHGIRRIISRTGETLYDAKFTAKQVVDKTTAEIVTWMLQGVVDSGTGTPAQLDRPAAGKTGTSEKVRDLWFIGYIPQLATGVWLGNDDNSPTWSTSGTAAEVWRNFMIVAVNGMPSEKFAPLPPVDGRKGSIKAKPVQPQRVRSGPIPAEESSEPSDDSGYSGSSGGGSSYERSQEYYEPAPQEAAPAEPAPEPPAALPVEQAAPEPPPPAAPAAPPPEAMPVEPPPPAPASTN